MNFLQFNYVPNHSNTLLNSSFSNAHTAEIETAPDSLVPCDSHHPPLSLKYKVSAPITMINNKHSFHDFKNVYYNLIVLSQTVKDLISTFIHQSADNYAILLRSVLIDTIHCFVSLKTFYRYLFPNWVSPKLKSLLNKRKIAHKKYKVTDYIQDYNVFSCLRSQCKVENLNYALGHIQTILKFN